MMRVILVFFLLFPIMLSANDDITASSYLLVENETFHVIQGRNYHEQLPPASTTKVMTAILALERLDGMEKIVPDSAVRRIPRSKLNIIPGRQYDSIDLIKGLMVESANDAAYALATHIGGTERQFAEMMTDKAREIGAINTQFQNASGLSARGHYTTCYDLALMMKYALRNERFLDVASMKYFVFEYNSRRKVQYKNHNRFLFCFEQAIAGKTGFTRASRHCYVGAFAKDGKIYILSMLHSRDLWGDAVKILSALYENLPTDRELRIAKSRTSAVLCSKEKPRKASVAKKKKRVIRRKEVVSR